METFSTLLALCAGNWPVTGEFPAQSPMTRTFNVFFVLRMDKWMSKQSWAWWFETPSCSLWRHWNGACHFLWQTERVNRTAPRPADWRNMLGKDAVGHVVNLKLNFCCTLSFSTKMESSTQLWYDRTWTGQCVFHGIAYLMVWLAFLPRVLMTWRTARTGISNVRSPM